MIEIKHRWNGTVLYSSDTATNTLEAVKEAIAKQADLRSANLSSADLRSANLSYADLSYADLRYADLRSADLRSANLSYADLSSADLRSADLRSANLRYANLRSANLSYAKGINKHFTTPLYSLLYTDGQITAFKLTTAEGEGIYKGGITYKAGEVVSIDNANTNEYQDCGAGINVASLDWCCREWKPGYRIFKINHTREDIACIPIGSDGKYRLHRGTVGDEINVKDLGLGVAEGAPPCAV